jgi:uncharacterized membrane protein YphA (DoxX/SURF4 family)
MKTASNGFTPAKDWAEHHSGLAHWAYWATTGLAALAFAFGGLADVMLAPDVRDGFARLGYPMYFAILLGTWKLLGAAALLAPGLPRLKEWAYAGMFFDLTGAAASHVAVGDSAPNVLTPLLVLVIVAASWRLRPASRTLASGEPSAGVASDARAVAAT